MPEPEWFLLQGGHQLGPFNRDQLTRRLAYRTPDMLVWRAGLSGWMRPAEVPELGPPRPAMVASAAAPQAVEEDKAPQFSAAFQALAQAYGAAVRTEDDELTFGVTHEGIPMTVRCAPGRSDASLEVTARGAHPPVRIYAEGGFERLGKRLGLNREVQTGDEEFDRRVYLDTPLPPEAVRDIAGRAGLRRGVLTVLEQGFDQVELDHEGILVTRDVEHPQELVRTRLDQTLSAVAEVAASLRGINPAWSRQRRSAWPLWVTGIGAAAAVAGVVALYVASGAWPPAGFGPLTTGVAAGAVAWLLAMAVLVRLLWGRSDALLHLTLSAVVLLVALPTLGAAALYAANGSFDRSPPVVRQTVLRSKWVSRSRGVRVAGPLRARQRRYYVMVLDGSQLRTLRVPQALYDSVKPGASLMVSVRPGALGWEWDEKPQ
jgi:hypothetical protein